MSQSVYKLAKTSTMRVEPSKDGNPYGAYIYFECLSRGAAQTLGLALRRTLLYAVQGSAVTSLQIDGVAHEFANISGVKEDVIDVVLNLKNVVISRPISTLQVVKLHIEGPCELRAGAIEGACEGVTVINKDQLILTVTDNVKLNLRLTIESGCGYEANVTDNHSNSLYMSSGGVKGAVGVIPIDASFCPIERVIFDVGHSRLGRITDYDRLRIFVETNGSVTPEKAIAYAAKVLRDQLTVLAGADSSDSAHQDGDCRRNGINEYLSLKIEELELSVRCQNCLKSENIVYLGDLVQYSEMQMLKMPNFGKKSLMELKALMNVYDLSFGMKVPDWNKDGICKKEQDNG